MGIPPQGQQPVMDLLHEGHPGMTRMKALARSFVWWPRIDISLETTIKECTQCQITRHSPPKAPLHPWEFPSVPWERLHIDFAGPCFGGHTFLIVVDAFSQWLEVLHMTSTTSTATIQKLRTLFATDGLPQVLVSDNGLQFTSTEFATFSRGNGICHVFSSSYHPSSNGLAEQAVQTFTTTLLGFYCGTGSHLTQPRAPPAELLLGRRPRSKLDLLRLDLKAKVGERTHKKKVHHDVHAKERSFKLNDQYLSETSLTKGENLASRQGSSTQRTVILSRRAFGWKNRPTPCGPYKNKQE